MRPTTAGSPAKRRCQAWWASITTWSRPGTSSSAVKPRPRTGRDAEHREEAGGDGGGLDLLRVALAGEGQGGVVEGRHVGEHAVVAAPVDVVRRRGGPAVAVVRRVDAHQAVRRGVGERAQQDGAHGAEDGGVGADAEGQGEHGDGGETEVAPQGAGGDPEVAGDDVHGRLRRAREVPERERAPVSGSVARGLQIRPLVGRSVWKRTLQPRWGHPSGFGVLRFRHR